jgi:hypothetical protein
MTGTETKKMEIIGLALQILQLAVSIAILINASRRK